MILRLKAADFGKFKDRTFELGAVTVVHGPNEAGKTTFFDALFQALCRPSETKAMGKVLKKRYGAGRKAEVELEGAFEIDEDEFLNLAAIRAGDLDVEMGKGSVWLDKLKSRLFHGGLDPAALAAEFQKRSSDNRTYAHVKELEVLRERASASRQELDRRLREREAWLARERTLAGDEARLEETRRLRDANLEERKAVQAQLAFEEKVERRRKLAAGLARQEEWDALQARLKELEPYREDRRSEWEALSRTAKAAAERIQADRARRDSRTDQAAKARAALVRLEEQKAWNVDRASLAASVASEFRKAGPESSAGSGAPAAWIPSALVLVAGAFGAFLVPGLTPKLVAVALALILSVALWIGMRRVASGRAVERSRQALAAAKDRFALGEMDLAARHGEAGRDGRQSLGEISTAEGLLQALDRIALEGETWERQAAAARREAAQSEEEAARSESAFAESREQEEDARRAEKDWLEGQGVSRPEEYFLQVGRYAQLREDMAKRQKEKDALAGQVGTEEKRDISRQLKDLDEEGVPRQGLDEAALQRLRRKSQELEQTRERLEKEFTERTANKERQAGEIRGTLGKLAAEIVRSEEEVLQREGQVSDKELDRRAAAMAFEIFKEIGEGSDLLLSGLSRELEGMLGHILPGSRAVTLLGLDQKQITVVDAAGLKRPLENLSSGTRDAVVLAAKLALALKTREGAGLLVLDDPFIAMDRVREERALRMLQDFHLRHGWQIILLTKDAHLRDGMARIFPELRILEL